MKKKVLIACLSVFLLLSFLGTLFYFSSVNNTEKRPEIMEIAQSSFKRFNPSDMYVKPIGRTHYSDGKRFISMSGSGVEFLCKGSYVYVTIMGDNAEDINENYQARFAIYKDGELFVDDTVNFKKKKYHIDINDFEKGAVIKIVKLSEAKHSGFYVGTIGSFCSGDIEPTEDKTLKIEFIGDSLTCGYGIEAGSVGTFSTKTENFTKTYAYLTAERLNADYSVISFSGYGLLSGYTPNGVINREDTVGKYYDKSALYYDGGKALWNFSSFVPDFVVINLGANDSTYCTTFQRQQVFMTKYCDFIKQIRMKYPDAYIICALGDVNYSLYPAIEKAVENYRISENDYKIQSVVLEFRMGENEIVIDGHPGADSNKLASDSLTQTILNIIDEQS